MPAKGTTRVTGSQRRAIAHGKIAGKTAADIAAETGLAPVTVDKQSRDPRTQTLIQHLKIEHEEPLRRAFVRSLETIEEHLDSDDASVVRDARRDLMKIMEAGDPPLSRLEVANDKTTTSGDFTLAELLSTWRMMTDGNPQP